MSVVEIATAFAAMLPPVGGAIAWVVRRFDRQLAAIKVELAECRARDRISNEQRGLRTTVVELLWQEIERLSPGIANPVLERAKRLLDRVRKLDELAALPPLDPVLTSLLKAFDDPALALEEV